MTGNARISNRQRPTALAIGLAALLLGAIAAPCDAQETGGDALPPLDVENVTIVGTRVIKLPAARKSEVVDSSVYILPAGDSLIFGERVSNFGGPGGSLPQYREFDPPATATLEGSFGTFLSPRARAHGELVKKPFDAMATVDYRATAGHTDSAEARSLLLDLQTGMLLGGDDPSVPRVRVGAGVDNVSDNYYLFGTRRSPYDRARSATRISASLQSAQDALVDYDLYLSMAQTSVEDRLGDSTWEASATAPGFGLALGAGSDTLRGRLSIDYLITSFMYRESVPTPNFVRVAGEAEYQPVAGLYLTAGLGYYGGQNSDSGSATLLMPRVAARYSAITATAGQPALSLFAWFAPEMRPASYRDRIMQAPYVDRELLLKPERVPVSLTAGARYSTLKLGMEARATFEQAENTPVVAADSAAVGALRWAHVDSRTLAALVTMNFEPADRWTAGLDLQARSSVARSTDEQLPMVPKIDFNMHATYMPDDALVFNASVRWVSEMSTTLGATPRSIPSRFVVDLGALYRLGRRLELFGEATNLLAQRYRLWEGYSAPGLELRGGARLRF